MNGTIADLFGFLAIATTLSVFIQKNQTTLIIMKVLVNMLWAVYFFFAQLLGNCRIIFRMCNSSCGGIAGDSCVELWQEVGRWKEMAMGVYLIGLGW